MADNIHECAKRECKTPLFLDGKQYKPGLDVQENSLLEGNKNGIGSGASLSARYETNQLNNDKNAAENSDLIDTYNIY